MVELALTTLHVLNAFPGIPKASCPEISASPLQMETPIRVQKKFHMVDFSLSSQDTVED